MASQNQVLGKGAVAGGAVNKKRFCKLTATQVAVQCDTSGEKAYGVARFSVSTAEIDKGKHLSLIVMGRAIVEAGDGTPVIGGPCMTDNQGRGVAATGSGKHILGTFDEVPAGVAAGDEVSVNLSLAGGVALP